MYAPRYTFAAALMCSHNGNALCGTDVSRAVTNFPKQSCETNMSDACRCALYGSPCDSLCHGPTDCGASGNIAASGQAPPAEGVPLCPIGTLIFTLWHVVQI